MSELEEKQVFWEAHDLPAPGSSIKREAFEALPAVSFHMEWHDGVVVYPNWNEETMSPAPNLRHQSVVMQVIQLLLTVIPDGQLFTAPTDVDLSSKTVQPDVFWLSGLRAQALMEQQAIRIPPDLIVEVLSPHNTENDRVTKFALYEGAEVREYWIVNPQENYIEVYALEDSSYRRVGAYTPGQTFASPILKQSVTVARIFNA